MRQAKIGLLSLLFAAMLACLVALPFVAQTASAVDEGSFVTGEYSYTISVSPPVGNRYFTRTDIYIDDIDESFGSIVKSFSYPSSYKVKATVNSALIYDAFFAICDARGIDLDTYNPNNKNYLTRTRLKIFGAEQDIENGQFSWNEINSDTDMNPHIKDSIFSASDEYEINGEYIFVYVEAYTQLHFHYNLKPVTMAPLGDGSLIYLSSSYYYDPVTEGGVQEHTSIYTHSEGDIFSTDDNSQGYIVGSTSTSGLPNKDFTMTFIYNGKAEIEGSEYNLNIYELPDTPYTVQGKLDFKSKDGQWHTLYTNVITVQKHTFEMRIDGTDDYRVGVGVEHEYSFIFDKNNITDFSITQKELEFFDEATPSTIEDSLKIEYAYSSVGKKTVTFSLTLHFNGGREEVEFHTMVFEVEVFSEEPDIIYPDYQVTFNLPDIAYALLGGNEFDVSASINEFFGDEHFTTDISISGVSVGIVSRTDSSLRLVPLGVGRTAIFFTATSTTAGEFSGSIFVDILESTSSNTEIVFDEEFNLTGSNVVAHLSVAGITEIINCTPNWSVKVESGDTYTPTTFIVNEDNAAVIEKAARGYYQFTISGNGISETEVVRRVTDINMAELAEKILPYLALIMVLFTIIVIILHVRSKKHKTLLKRLQKTQSILDSAIKEKVSRSSFNRLLKSLTKSMKRSLTAASARDLETLGLYQNLCSLITKSIQICEAAKVNSNKMGKVLTGKFLKNIKKHYIDEAVRMCSEIDDSLDKFAKVKAVAITVAPESKSDISHKQIHYKQMLNKFYKQGDDVDSNNRSGDDDRDDDSKTEG